MLAPHHLRPDVVRHALSSVRTRGELQEDHIVPDDKKCQVIYS